jgi:hypothetical protein
MRAVRARRAARLACGLPLCRTGACLLLFFARGNVELDDLAVVVVVVSAASGDKTIIHASETASHRFSLDAEIGQFATLIIPL